MWREPLETFPDEAWDAVLDLNLKSPFWLVRVLLPALRRAGAADDPARIINIGSIAALHVAESPNCSYASSKAGLHQLTRVLARELGPQHVTVNVVAPGPFPGQGSHARPMVRLRVRAVVKVDLRGWRRRRRLWVR